MRPRWHRAQIGPINGDAGNGSARGALSRAALGGANMSTPSATLVRRFYDEVWNQADEAVAREILHENFSFRASLGPERRGPEGFIAYMRAIHHALGGYTCTIVDLVATEDRAAARMVFKG